MRCRYVRGASIQFQGRRYACESRTDRCCQSWRPGGVEAYVRSVCFIRSQILKYRPDEVVNFYEMLSGLAVKCFRLPVDMVGVGHQYLMLHRGYRQGSRRGLNAGLLRQHVRMMRLGAAFVGVVVYPMGGDRARA